MVGVRYYRAFNPSIYRKEEKERHSVRRWAACVQCDIVSFRGGN